MPLPTAFNICDVAFCLPHQLVGFLLDKTLNSIFTLFRDLHWSASFVRRHPSQSEQFIYLKNGFTSKFYVVIHANLVNSLSGYDITSYFQ